MTLALQADRGRGGIQLLSPLEATWASCAAAYALTVTWESAEDALHDERERGVAGEMHPALQSR